MKFFKIRTHKKKYINYIFLLGIILLTNSFEALGSHYQSHFRKKNKNYDFEKVYFNNSIPYSEYDDFDFQLKSFLGLRSDQSTINNYPDLIIISDSDALREIYRSKLNDMIINKSINKFKK